ncbi:bifunctional hydroxymethylpyrimidine kinase/phosphomethylpyrimidine kinase [Alkalicella caledoniensis]|uniref:Hydroxymethylpyrimidine/phosphomethylpyrimidine kinase n=1 Tax=Alkalicella caledoniensis TaxID=2731377 RepID=A0A7G9W5B5_ALKCA|nr:bifunctional hydroxymethylpyrimidine kinase/phosphomethylpyrimidine kinase [Alkalicella caledoniensis]QNO13877.1 bifunctional hydroxymethylpyrimidine kinase/phosphomethylpyrimidine kinase [Alkalicella caledoniensis]
MKNLLTIAGSDSSGGAGIQADLKTFSAHGTFGMSVITAVTAQNTQGVFAVENISPDVVGAQIDAIFTDIEVDAVKVGMVSQTEIIKIIAEKLKKYKFKKVVIDPVMISKSGYHLLEPEAKKALIEELVPLAYVVTPNIPEAEELTGIKIDKFDDMEKAAISIKSMGAQNVLIKGGHLETEATDILYDGEKFHYLKGEKIPTKNTHGTGCTLSSAIAANIGRGLSVIDAVKGSKEYIIVAIENALQIGKGVGPTHHFYNLYKGAGMLDE